MLQDALFMPFSAGNFEDVIGHTIELILCPLVDGLFLKGEDFL